MQACRRTGVQGYRRHVYVRCVLVLYVTSMLGQVRHIGADNLEGNLAVLEMCFEKPAVLCAPHLANLAPPPPAIPTPPPAAAPRAAAPPAVAPRAAAPPAAAPRAAALVLNFGEVGPRGRAALFSGLLRRGLFAGYNHRGWRLQP